MDKMVVWNFQILSFKDFPCESESVTCSVVSDSLQPHGLCPTRLLCHGILQARILELVVIPFSKKYSQTRDRTQVSCIEGRFFII